MNDHTRIHAPRATGALQDASIERVEAGLVGQHKHAATGNDWRDVYRRADIELRLHLAAGSVDADELASVGRQPKLAAR